MAVPYKYCKLCGKSNGHFTHCSLYPKFETGLPEDLTILFLSQAKSAEEKEHYKKELLRIWGK